MRAAAWAEVSLTSTGLERLAVYQTWLAREGIPAGGLGPGEIEDLPRRHLADSLLFAGAWRSHSQPESIADFGSGLGLPGIPLAITHPETEVTLIERSGRRCRLLRRAIWMLGLENTDVVECEAESLERRWPVVVARAAGRPDRMLGLIQGLLVPGGYGVVGGSHGSRVEWRGYTTMVVPAEVLDREVSLLIMATS